MSIVRNKTAAAAEQSSSNPGGFASRPERSASSVALAPGWEDQVAYVRFDNPTPEVPWGDPIGYTYRAEDVTGETLVEALIREGRLSPGARGMRVEDALDQLAATEDIDREDETTFDTGEFPKKVHQDQLSCSDEWAGDYAPEHISSRSEFPECVRCGADMPSELTTDD